MLQPRSCGIACLLLVVLVTALAEDPLQDEDAKERFKRENGDVTVLSLEEIAGLREAPPVGVLSSTARTFVTGGATTEYATQILGTTVGRTYARLLSTGTRVFYDNVKPSKDPTPYLVFPTLSAILQPSAVEQSPVQPTQSPALEEPVDFVTGAAVLNEIPGHPEQTTSPPKPSIFSVRKEFSVKRNTGTDVRPAKVKPSSDLPTVTIKAEFAPSGYSDSVEERKEKKLRAGKGLFRGGVQIKNEFQKYDTVTYVGFADFTTTVGNTIIVFMPKTAVAANGPVTSIAGAATLRPEDAGAPVVTTVKTFLSHSPGMATKTVTGHNLDVQTTLPTVQADRASKAYNPVYYTTEEMGETTERATTPAITSEKAPLNEDIMTTEHTTSFSTDQEPKTEQTEPETLANHEHPTTELTSTEAEEFSTPEGSEVDMPHEEVEATEALRITPTFATTSTQVFIPGDQPLGLAKSISVVEAFDETTTHYTSFLFGTVVDGEYTQLTQVVSSVAAPSSIVPTPVATNLVNTMMSPETTEIPVGSAEDTMDEKEETADEATSQPVKLITKLVPATVHQTYTYLTTFFVPQGDTTTTSVRTREVVSDEIRYVATVIPENQITPSSETISPTDVMQSYQTSTPLEPTTEESTEQPTPHLPDTTLSAVTQEATSPMAEDSSTTTEGTTIEPEPIAPTPENTSVPEEEVEVIIRTLYTTYTYLTTFFQETTTSVQSREVVETNVVTSTLDSASIPEATDPAVAGLFKPTSSSSFAALLPASQANAVERPPSEETFLKTYTYYTTVFVDGETIVESETKVVEETIQPTSTTSQIYKTASSDDNRVIPKELNDLEASEDRTNQKKRPMYGTISRPTAPDLPTSEALVMPHSLQSSIDDAYSYDTTMSSADRAASTKTTEEADEAELEQAREEELKKEAMLAMGMTTTTEDELIETMVTDITSSSSGGSRRKAFEEYESDPNDQISSESNTEEIEPSFSPTILLQTSYTTFTYFTTVYKGPSSDIISRLETVTNVVTETVKPTEIEPNLSPEEATLPITYFTTFTYWTTLYRGKNTMITSREETVSNVVTPTLDNEYSSLIEMTESPISPTSTIETIAATVPTDANVFTVAVSPSEIIATPIEPSIDQPEENTSTDMVLDPTTYYTTYTYFTTSYIGNETVINSHLETETNIETPKKSMPVEVTEPQSTSRIDVAEATPALESASPSLQPTGLISTIRSSEVNDGITTLLNTDVYGTYIDGLYAQVLESSSEIVAPSQASSVDSLQPTGIVSINEGKIVDANGVTTTLFTTKAIGTYIDALYAQVLESTSSVVVDEAKKTESPTNVESTTVLGSKVFTTGLVRLIEGSIVKDHTTTYYESRVIGTLIDGRYAQIIESTSSFKADVTPTAGISPSSTIPPASEISPTLSITTSSPAVIEGSQGADDDEDSDEDDQDNGKSRLGFQSKKKTFTPVIRPFSSRPRPTFQPKKKTGDPATTITRTSFTPTVTATPASKTGFGSSRNRFAANRSKGSSSQLEIKPTASSSRRFSRPRSNSNAAPSFGGSSSSQSFGRGRSSSRVQPTASVSVPPRRGGFSYRSSGRPNIALSTSARARIGPTRANPFNRFTSTTPVDDININDITGGAATEEVEHNTASEEEEVEQVTSAPTTTTESPRRAGNPLLRFRRPPILQRSQTTTSTTSKPSTTPKRQSPSLLRRPDSRSGVPVTITPRSRPTVNFNRIKPRPSSSLFPPRGLAKKPTQEEVEEEKEEQENSREAGEEEIEDNEYEGSETAEQTSSTTTETPKNNRRSKALGSVVQIRPFTRRPRAKRQADYGGRTYSARYRRPVPRASYDYEEDYSAEPVKEVPTRAPTSRGYSSRTRNQQIQSRDHSRDVQTPQPRVRASPVPSTPRHQFTLRERTSQPQTTMSPARSNFRRPPRRRVSQELTTQPQRLSKPVTRHRTVTTEPPTSYSRGTSRRYNQQTSRRTTARSRYRDNIDLDTYSPKPFDGTITVTHKIPTEVTIPIVNGKNTEYKPVITAKPSLEVLGPYQYTSTTGKDGKPTIILNSDITSTLPSGFMEVTKFLVFETPTTSVTFTPTTLRGRKTSFSHIVPSTVYEVRPEVSTIQPNLGDNPLANILLSQLLLGNLAQPTVAGQPQTPVTEYKTKTTTYVTTVTSHTSTILPLTFRGKEITTTIVDSSVQVITATEYLTETVVVTPTAVVQPAISNQLNTLLLPALLQAQLLNQQTPNPLLRKPTDDLYNNNRPLDEDDPEQRYNRQKDEEIDDDRKVRESVETEQDVEQKPARKKSKIKLKEKDKGSSVITLYVSGKHPGEFTTLLSTVPINEESSGNLKKREVSLASFNLDEFRIQASKTPELGSSFTDDISNYISPLGDGIIIESSEVENVNGESEVGEFSRYLDLSKSIHPEIVSKANTEESLESRTGHFLLVGHADSAPNQRKATPRGAPFPQRRKRDTTPVRRVIRVRVPVKKTQDFTPVESDFDDEMASSHNEQISRGDEPQMTEEPERKVKKVLIARRRQYEQPPELKRKRIIITRKHFMQDEPSPVERHETVTPTAARKRVLKTKKRLIAGEPELVDETDDLPRKRITVTRKRVIQTDSASSYRGKDEMQTLYNYQYSIPGDKGSSVMVTQLYMTGDKETSDMNNDADFKELMDSAYPERSREYSTEQDSSQVEESYENNQSLNGDMGNRDLSKAQDPSVQEIENQHKDGEEETQVDKQEVGDQEVLGGEEVMHLSEEGDTTSPFTPVQYDYYDDEEELDENQERNTYDDTSKSEELSDFELDPTYVTLFPYDTTDTSSMTDEVSVTETSDGSLELDPTYVTLFPYETTEGASTTDETRVSETSSRTIELDPTYVTLFPYDTADRTSITSSSSGTLELDPTYVTLFPYDTPEAELTFDSVSSSFPESVAAAMSKSIQLHETTETSNTESNPEPVPIESPPATTIPTEPAPMHPLPEDPTPADPIDSPQISAQPTTEYQTLTKTITTTRLRTFTYVVTRVSGDEQYVTSSTTVKPHIKTTTVTEILPISTTQSAASSVGGRGLYVMEPRYNLATKVMANGVEVIVAGDKSTLPGSPLHRIIPSGLAKPITLAPSTLTDHMMMLLPPESQKPQNDFVTKTYMTTYTYLTTFARGGSTVVSSREKVVGNLVTEEMRPSRTQGPEHFTLASSPVMSTGVYHTTYTYLNTLVDGERPLVVTSKKTVTNTKTEQPSSTQPSPQPQDTNTYFSTVAYSKTLNDGDQAKVVKTEDVLTQVVITESDYIPLSAADKNRVTPTTTEVTKTYFATYTYFNTKVVDGSTVIKTEVATSSDVVAETFTITPKKSSTGHITNEPSKVVQEPVPMNSIHFYATKTYLTTFTYFTTLLQDNKSPSTIIKSRTKVQQNIVTEKVDDSLIDPGYLNILKSSVNDKRDSVVATATLSNGNKMEITAVASKLVNPTQNVQLGSSFGGTPSNVITGSTIIFFDDDVQPTPALESSFIEPTSEYAALTTQTPALVTATPAPSSASISTGSNTKITSPEDGDESMMVELAADPAATSDGASPVNNIFHGLNALGPVINAMADLFQNNFSGGKKKNETQVIYKPQAFPYQRPMITGNNDGHNTHASPVYVPTYDSSDSEPAESQHVGGGNVFLDVNQRTKHGGERPSIEEALLSSGIPISPGQVITTNSDVIIGKHAVHGPRPPHKPFGKNDLVEGMKPPPLPQQPAVPSSAAHHTYDQQHSAPPSAPQQAKPGTSNKPVWPPRDQDRFASVPIPQRVPLLGSQDAPPLVPPPLRPQFVHHQKHPGKPSHHDHGSEEQKYSMLIDPPKESQVKPFKYYKNPALQRRPHDPPRKESNNHEPPYRGEPYKNEKNRQRPPKPTAMINREDGSNYDKSNHVNMSVAHQVNPIPHQPFSTTPAVDQTLLVNIQPSQVANVVIPHGLSTALIYSGSSEMPGQKGEIFNDATPYKDAEVGMVGVAGLSTSNGEATHVPLNAVRLDVPVSPQAVDIQSLKRPSEPNRRRPGQSYRPPANPLSEYMKPPPPPPTPHISTYVNYHLPKEPVEDQEGDYTVNNEFHTSSEENKNGPTNHNPRPNWGSKINSGLIIPNSPTPFKYFTNHSNEPGNPGMQYSVINSKPVILGYDNTDKQPPIVKGKPGVTTFDNNDEATVSVGQPTNLAPADEIPTMIPTALSKQDNPIMPPPMSYDFKREKPIQNKPVYKPKPNQAKPVDNIKYAMNLDEKPPAPTYETPPQSSIYDVPSTIDSAPNSMGPDRNHGPQDESVVGLTPPAAAGNKPNIQERSTHRPPITDRPTHRTEFTSRRPFPIRKRPPPPYKFEIPLSTAPPKPKKPSHQGTVKPQTVGVPAENLSPPKSTQQSYQINDWKYTNKYNNDSHHHTPSVSINPVLGGFLKVEELAQKPEVITADVKVPTDESNVLYDKYNFDRPSQETQMNNQQTHPNEVVHFSHDSASTPSPAGFPMSLDNDSSYSESNNDAHEQLPVGEVVNSNNASPANQKHTPNLNQYGSNVIFGMKVKPHGFQLSKDSHEQVSNVDYFTESDSVNDKTIKDRNRLPLEVQKVSPVSTDLYSPTPTPSSSFRQPEYDQIIVGSETVYLPDESVTSATPQINERPNTLVHFQQASTANMIKVTTGPTTHTYVTPVRSYESSHSVIPLQLKNRTSYDIDGFGGDKKKEANIQSSDVPLQPTTYIVTHTQTLTVTTTESRIVQSKGQKPSTHTVVLTKTHTSTILDTVTEVHTLVKPTSIVQTVTTTIPQATTTIFPTKVRTGIEGTVTIERQPPPKAVVDDSDSILVVMTDKNSKNTLPHFNVDPSNEPQLEIEAPAEEDEVNPNVLLGGLLSRSPENECKPECKASRNERCQKLNGVMHCVCRPGFARMFAERPCKPTYTFSMQVPLERVGKEKIRFTNGLTDVSSSVYQHLAEATKEGLDRMVMQSDLRDVYHGLYVTGFGMNNNNINNTMAKFYIQLSENTNETKLEDVFRKHLRTNNFSMGGTELHASKEKLDFLRADDFDECTDSKFNDCSENAQCFNLRGTYTCSCREGFTDLSHNTLYPGRICSAEMIGCDRCNFHGNCFPRETEEDLCECFQWYAGQYCQINLKVLLLILSLVGISLVVLLVVCLVLSCMRRRPLGGRGISASQLRPPGFRLRPHQPQDKRAMISMDTSSEASMDHTPPPYIKQAASLQSQVARPQKPCRKMSKAPSPPISYHGTMEQRDRSLTVMIPRAKYRPVPAPGSNLTMSTFGPEQKLLKYLTVEKPQNSRSNSRKPSNSTTNSQETAAPKKLSHAQAPPPRKPSTGALVSAGFEVSATVGRTKEIQECFISEPHTDLNLNQGGFSTIRTADSSVLVDVPPPPTLEAELLDSSRVDLLTVSEARSYDETLIQPPTKSLRSNYDRNSEGHTMVERDTGSTFVMPQSQLYRPDRGNGSDISNFDSL